MRLEVPYGTGTQLVQLPDEDLLCVIHPKEMPSLDGSQILLDALMHPLQSPSLEKFLEDGKNVLVVVNDATRPTPTAAVLARIFPLLEQRKVRYVVATGTHRPATADEYRKIFGELYSRIRSDVCSHDAQKSETVLLGISRHGTPLRLNRMVLEADRIIAISSVEPHYFAGFTGGRKSFLPGLAALETVEANHKMAMREEVCPLRLEGNPVHEDMADLMRLLRDKQIFSIQAVLDAKRRTCAAFTGDLETSFRAAARRAEEIFVAKLDRHADVVIAVAEPPLDINFYQITKSVETAKYALRDGGALILVGACREGIGTSSWVDLLRQSETLEQCLEKIASAYKLSDHKAARIWRLGLRYKLIAVTEIAPEIIRQAHFTPAASVQQALDMARAMLGSDVKAAVLLDAVHLVPIVEPAPAAKRAAVPFRE